MQYADYALWQQQLVHGWAADQLDYWQRTLHGAPEELELPTDRPRPIRPTFQGAEVAITLPQGMQDLARDTGASMFMLLHAAVAALLAGKVPLADGPVVAVVSGGNADPKVVAGILAGR